MNWTAEDDNDVNHGDGGFYTWWVVCYKGGRQFETDEKAVADWLVELLNRTDAVPPTLE